MYTVYIWFWPTLFVRVKYVRIYNKENVVCVPRLLAMIKLDLLFLEINSQVSRDCPCMCREEHKHKVTHAHTHAYTHIHTHARTHTCLHAHLYRTHAQKHTHTHTHTVRSAATQRWRSCWRRLRLFLHPPQSVEKARELKTWTPVRGFWSAWRARCHG